MNPIAAIFAILRFLAIYAWEVCRGGIRIAWDVFTPGLMVSPRIVELPIPPMGPVHHLMLANLISMTPGSLSVDYADGGTVLRIHLLYADTDAVPLERTVRKHFLPLVQSLPKRTRP
jgi:multicomponent Na+:H+ antiporter subunit E